MPNKHDHSLLASLTKRCYFAGRAVMDAALRAHDIGSTQWFVLHHLALSGPMMQRDLVDLLQVERATLSVIIRELVRKGLVEQVPVERDARRKMLQMTDAGKALWDQLPNFETLIHATAFGEIPEADIAAAIRVLSIATERLTNLSLKGDRT
ncbi:MarR family winged helix-turn-helix transcriptional regulator [Sphingomonas soli]|uniref:MarR family winged helix-turn-helix transcriptional regulator n=1 Tax=Sphingomonas soli TaxID=266127 RepID=UPI00082C4295|nr:MarR family transcriptional regulator [Sphingomonas soli]